MKRNHLKTIQNLRKARLSTIDPIRDQKRYEILQDSIYKTNLDQAKEFYRKIDSNKQPDQKRAFHKVLMREEYCNYLSIALRNAKNTPIMNILRDKIVRDEKYLSDLIDSMPWIDNPCSMLNIHQIYLHEQTFINPNKTEAGQEEIQEKNSYYKKTAKEKKLYDFTFGKERQFLIDLIKNNPGKSEKQLADLANERDISCLQANNKKTKKVTRERMETLLKNLKKVDEKLSCQIKETTHYKKRLYYYGNVK